MHRRDLLEKTGPYNENLNVLIDWDITRRLAFFSDFHHIPKITGEYYNPIGESDRISVKQRKDAKEYLKNVLAIRTTIPPKPWLIIADMSIIFAPQNLDTQAAKTIGYIWRYTFFPYHLYLPLPQSDFARLNTAMPNIVFVPVNPSLSQIQRIDAALEFCDGEYVTIVPDGFPVKDFWMEGSLYALINSSVLREGFYLEGSTDVLWAVVLKKADLQYARKGFANLSLQQSLKAAGITVKQPVLEQLPFQFDNLLQQARLAEKDGDWLQAAQMFEQIADSHQNRLWMKALAARAFFKAGNYARAADLASRLNQQRPTVDTLLLEAKLNRQIKKFNPAIDLLKKAQRILEGPELLWT